MKTSQLTALLLVVFISFISCSCSASRDAIEGLKPKKVWDFFYKVSCIPRCSDNEKGIRDYLIENYAKKYKYEYIVDKAGNLIIKVPSTPGFESKPTIILQTHLDMVCEKNEGTNHDFEKDPIQLMRDETKKWIKANQTTLGADDGIGMAKALRLGSDKNLNHGPLELLFTVGEEIGLIGALNLEKGILKGKILINIDSSIEAGITVGSAGGLDLENIFRPSFKIAPRNHQNYSIKIYKLLGGHSGVDIHRRVNAIKVLMRLLNHISLDDENREWFNVINIIANSKSNAIPRESTLEISLNPTDESKLKNLVEKIMNDIKQEFKTNEPNLSYSIEKSTKLNEIQRVLTKTDEKKIRNILQVFPNGVLTIDPDLPVKQVKTSSNLAAVELKDGKFTILSSIRSSSEIDMNNTISMIENLFDLVNAETRTFSRYPSWKPNLNSNLLKYAQSAFKDVMGKEPQLTAIHAGLEPGVIESIYPGLEMMSIGSWLDSPHSPDEKILISSIKQCYDILFKTIEKLSK